MTIFGQITAKIIREQALIIGPLAWEEARKVEGLTVADTKKGEVEIRGDEKTVVDKLIGRYERLFGRASHEVCRSAVASLVAELPADQVPSSLK